METELDLLALHEALNELAEADEQQDTNCRATQILTPFGLPQGFAFRAPQKRKGYDRGTATNRSP